MGVENKSWKLKFLFFPKVLSYNCSTVYLPSSLSKAPWCRCLTTIRINPVELGCTVETRNPNSQCLKAAKLVHCLWSIPILEHEDELLIIDTQNQASSNSSPTHAFMITEVGKGPKAWLSCPLTFYWSKKVIGTSLMLLGWRIINIPQRGAEYICE